MPASVTALVLIVMSLFINDLKMSAGFRENPPSRASVTRPGQSPVAASPDVNIEDWTVTATSLAIHRALHSLLAVAARGRSVLGVGGRREGAMPVEVTVLPAVTLASGTCIVPGQGGAQRADRDVPGWGKRAPENAHHTDKGTRRSFFSVTKGADISCGSGEVSPGHRRFLCCNTRGEGKNVNVNVFFGGILPGKGIPSPGDPLCSLSSNV